MKGKGKVPTWLLGAEEAPQTPPTSAPKSAPRAAPKATGKRVSFAEPRRGVWGGGVMFFVCVVFVVWCVL